MECIQCWVGMFLYHLAACLSTRAHNIIHFSLSAELSVSKDLQSHVYVVSEYSYKQLFHENSALNTGFEI